MVTLEVKKVKRSWCILAGVSVLGKFKTEEAAREDLEKDRAHYEYWAGSACVSVENTPAKVVKIGRAKRPAWWCLYHEEAFAALRGGAWVSLREFTSHTGVPRDLEEIGFIKSRSVTRGRCVTLEYKRIVEL